MSSTALDPGAPAAPTVEGRQMLYAIIASTLGWALDLFDLFILLYVAPVIGALFFPSTYPTLSLAAVYASFAVTLLMRPVGSALFGSYADRHGRKGAMVIAVVGVGLSTAAFGLLPTIAQAGALAPVLFLALRLVQGVLVGGVVASTHTIGTESVPARWRGAMSGLIGGGGAGIGALLASFVYLLATTLFPGDQFAVWGWRFMFFSGILSSVLGLFVFGTLEESPFFQRLHAERLAAAKARAEAGLTAIRSPLRTLFSADFGPVLLVNLLITTGAGAGYYITSGYLPTYLRVVNGIAPTTASLMLMGASVAAFVSAVLIGHLSTLIGRRVTFIGVGLVTVVLLPMLFLSMAGAHDATTVTLYALAIAFLGNAAYAPLLIFLNERFPTALRATGTGLSWNIGFAIGGMMPTFVSLASGTPAGIPLALAWFAGGAYLLYVIGAFIAPETRGRFD